MGFALALGACVSPVFGPEFQVNTTTAGNRFDAGVANLGPDGDFVVTWSTDEGQDGDQSGVFARLFDASGSPLGGEILINAFTIGSQFGPHVQSNAAGNFVVTWTSFVDGALLTEIRARPFDSSGVPQGGEALVNTYVTGQQFRSAVAIGGAGHFVVVWESFGQDGDGYGVFGRRFDADGNPLDAEFPVNEFTTGSQSWPRVAMTAGGDFLVVWNSPQDDEALAIMARRYASDGTPLGGEFQVNTTEAGNQTTPDVALDSAGQAVVAWTSLEQDGSLYGIYGQRLDASGNKIGPEFNVNTYTTDNQTFPKVSFDTSPDAGFVIVWRGSAQDGDGEGIFAQQFDSRGRRKDEELFVNSDTTFNQDVPAIAGQPNGQFVATWTINRPVGFTVAARVGGFPRVEHTRVDEPHAALVSGSGSSNLNGVLEVGEEVRVEPVYRNWSSQPLALGGTVTDLVGPPGLTYSIPFAFADYGTIASTALGDCFEATGICYRVSVTGIRPDGHLDAGLSETLSYHDFERSAALHIGESFPDVPQGNPFYAFIENLFHNGVTGGCAGGGYCPGNSVTRAQMAVFLMKSRWGAGFIPAPATGTAFPDVPADNLFAPWIEELVREGITAGCGGGNYCPNSPVTRAQMAIFLLKTEEGSAYVPPQGTGIFGDVLGCPNPTCNFIEELYSRSITGGCQPSPLLYCPGNPVLRQQMAAFLVKTFGLRLY